MRLALCTITMVVVACTAEPRSASEAGDAGSTTGHVVGRFARNETLTEEEVLREAAKLPPALREQFETPAGRREFERSLIDKRLLVLEARRRKLNEAAELRRQVREFEERLLVQALMAQEEAAAGSPSEQELRAWFDAHREQLIRPAQVRVGRVLVGVAPGASEAERGKARQKVESIAARLRKGEPLARLAQEGVGPERAHGGDLGLLSRGSSGLESAVEQAAFALDKPGAVSPVVAGRDGFVVLQLLELKPARVPSFEEVRAEVEGRVAPARKREVFDALLARLRQENTVELVDGKGAP